jgi:hypothetical protein
MHASQNLTARTTTQFESFLDFLQAHGHNFTRLWTNVAYLNPNITNYGPPYPWVRSAVPGASDGGNKFDMTAFNQSYFDTLVARVQAIADRGMFCSIMLFGSYNGFRSHWDKMAWYPSNNINPELSVFSTNEDFFTTDPETLEIQRALVRKTVDELNHFDNLIFEIMNEPGGSSKAVKWHKRMIDYVKSIESTRIKQHLIGMTGGPSTGKSAILLSSSAGWVSPDWADYRQGGTAAYSDKIILNDSDHIWGYSRLSEAEEMRKWIWKTFTRGNHPIWMDTYDENRPSLENYGVINHIWDKIRDTMGHTLKYANRFNNLANMIPTQDPMHCSTTYCLRSVAKEYLIYQPEGASFTIKLEAGNYKYEWFNPSEGIIKKTGKLSVKRGNHSFTPPFKGDAILYLHR